jgi:hypothetical protein
MSSVEASKSSAPAGESQPRCCEGSLRDWCAMAEKSAREEPAKCAAMAFVAGFLVTILPVGQILGGIVRLALGLIRPVLIILGAMKVLEEIEKRREP